MKALLILLISCLFCSQCVAGPCAIGLGGKCATLMCKGPMEFNDILGAVECKKCQLGWIPEKNLEGENVACTPCPPGSIGKRDGKCHLCTGPMSYTDIYGATQCRTCHLGWVPVEDFAGGHSRCKPCPAGTFGKVDGKCHSCSKSIEYSQVLGATHCKKCHSGWFAVKDHKENHVDCKQCPSGTYGDSDGTCYPCNGPMEYSDIKGAPKCKECHLGWVPSKNRRGRNIGCKKCRGGTFGKSDGKCHNCNGPLEYNNIRGAVQCHKCPPGTKPLKSRFGGNVGCKKLLL